MKNITHFSKILLFAALFLGSTYCTWASDVQTEHINRGLIALVRSDTSVYIGWRLLADDPKDIAFNLYRKTIGAVTPNDYV